MNNWIMNIFIYSLGTLALNSITKNKESSKKNHTLPDFRGVIQVKNALPGRIRFYIPLLKKNEEAKIFFLEQIQKLDGLKQAEINCILGTLLITYDENKLKPILVMGIVIKLLNLDEETKKQPQSLVKKEIENVKESLNLAVYDKTQGILDMKTLLTLILLGAGINKIRTTSQNMPGGLTYLWWAYSSLSK